MNKDIASGKWNEFTGEAKKLWGKLTDDDLKVAEGNVEAIKGRLTSEYGYSKERASAEVDSLWKRFSKEVSDVSEKAKNYFDEKTSKAGEKSSSLIALIAMSAAMLGATMPNIGFAENEITKKVENVVQAARTSVYKFTNKDTLVVKFKKGSSTLTSTEKKQIQALLKANQKNKAAMNVTVAAWSDKDFIKEAKTAETATSADEKLAEKRINVIKKYMDSQKFEYSVENEYNMAKEPSAVGSFFGTQDAVVKENVASEGKTDSVALNKDIELLKDEGGAQKAVIAFPELM